jgi:secreted PhoX family phosphatase
VTPRRHLLAAPALLLAVPPARAQTFRSDLAPGPLAVKQDDTVAAGYSRSVLSRWGDRVAFDAPAWNPSRPSAEAAAGQFGWDARVVALAVPPAGADGVARAVLAITHPEVNPVFAFPGGRDQPAVAAMMQGATLLNLEKRGRWAVVDGGYQNRRLHAATLCRVSGPAAAAAGEAVQGLLGLQGGAATPWGTLLLAEGDPARWARRLGGLEPRFASGAGFGWVAELDPFDPKSVPVKRSALGRANHGDLAAGLTRDGRAVVYTVDRRAGGHLYRFLSAGPATGADALDDGTLAVAKTQSGQLQWLPLPAGAAANPAEAARALGATGFDQPAGLGLDPRRARLLLACHGSAARPAGYLLELVPAGEDHASEGGRISLLFSAGAPGTVSAQYGRAGLPAGSAWVENPDSVAVDARGRAWVGTNRGGTVAQQPDALFAVDLEGPGRGVPLPIYGAPRAAAMGGAALTPDGEVLFTAVRHPGAEPGTSFERPATRWPEFEAGVPPRTTLIGLERAAGGAVGG